MAKMMVTNSMRPAKKKNSIACMDRCACVYTKKEIGSYSISSDRDAHVHSTQCTQQHMMCMYNDAAW